MGRLAVWLMVILLMAGVVRVATSARYEYFTDGTMQARKDRLTGAVQVWGCISQFRGTDTAYLPMAGDTSTDKSCARSGWIARK